ncbi:PolC-type DNA polymerase III [Candidatus Riflebacteria bacterium]
MGLFISFTLPIIIIIVVAALYDSLAPEYDKAKKRLFERESEKLKEGKYVVLDLETTGLDKRKCEIIEIGAFKIENMEVTDSFHSFVKPEGKIPKFITKMTGISEKTVKDAPALEKILPEFLEFCQDYTCVAHNAFFDRAFLRNAARSLNLTFPNPFIDTLKIARVHYPFWPNHKLPTVVENLCPDENKKWVKHHSGIEDARVLVDVFLCFLKENKVLLSD